MGSRDDDLDLEAELMAAMGDEEALASSQLQDIPLTSTAGLGLDADDEIGLETRKAAQQQIDKELGLTSGKALVEREEAKASAAAKRKRADSGDSDEGEDGGGGKKSRKKKKKKNETTADKKVRFDGESGDESQRQKRRGSSKKKKSSHTEEPKQEKEKDKDKDKDKPSQEAQRRERERERGRERDDEEQDEQDERMGMGAGVEAGMDVRGRKEKERQEDDRDDDVLNELLHGTGELMPAMDGDGDGNGEAAQQRIKCVLSSLTPAQRARYEVYRSSSFQPASIRRVLSSVCGITKMHATAPIVVAACAKLFVGQLIEQSSQISGDWGDSAGPLRPVHIREAYRRLQQQHVTSTTTPINRVMRKQLFKHR